MAWRLGTSVIKGEIDNRTRGQVVGKIWLVDRPEPITLSLAGNCLRDIAGCLVTFENPAPRPGDSLDMADQQDGQVGDITASRKVRVLELPVEEAYALRKAGKDVPEHIGNCLYLEWISRANGRVVIEGVEFTCRVSEPEWRMTADEEREQARANRRALRGWMSSMRSAARDEEDADEYRPMDEFEWEKSLKESDRLADKYGALLEKYMDHPERDKIIAKEMGWSWLEEELDEQEAAAKEEKGAEAPPPDEPDEDGEDGMQPDPATEGVNWVRTDRGRVSHPLAARAFEAAIGIWRTCDQRGFMKDPGDPDVQEMVFKAQTLSSKLAGALDGLAYDRETEAGFVVACLKRALKYFEGSLAALARVKEKKLLEPAILDAFSAELFAIRENMLRLMKEFRQKIW